MAISAGLGFGKEKSSSTTTGTTTTSGRTSTVGLEQLTAGDAASKAVLDTLTSLLGGQAGQVVSRAATGGAGAVAGFTKEDAIADSQALVKNIFTQFQQEQLPQIFAAQGATGGYSSTAAFQLGNEAFGRATANAAGTVADMIKDYATISQAQQQVDASSTTNFLSTLLGAIGLQQSATKTSTSDVTEDYTETSKYNYTTSGKGSSLGLSLAGGMK